MDEEFQSAFLRGGNILTPERIIITDDSVTWKKRNSFLIGTDSKTIPIDSIASIDIDQKLWGANITITSFGQDKIEAKNFTGADADRIKELLEELRSNK